MILCTSQDKKNFMISFTKKEEKALQRLQADIPLSARPFHQIAEACGFAGDDLIDWIKHLFQQGVIRKFGAILRHQNAGYDKNALVMWAVPADAIEAAGKQFAGLSFISHCYERQPAFQNTYNLFTMLHAKEETLAERIRQMSQIIGCNDFLVLESLQEYKKTSPEYF